MKIYKDKSLKEEVKILDLGIVPAGETKQFTFYVFNDENNTLVDLKFKVDHKEVKIVKAPTKLTYLEIGELVLEWTPSIELKRGLKATLQVEGTELWS